VSKPLVVVSANIAGATGVRPLAEECDQSHPDAIGLNEVASGSVRALRSIPAYRRPQLARVKGERFIGSMVRSNVIILNWWILAMNLWWRYKDRRKKPREFIVERIKADQQKWRVITVHFPTYGPNGVNRKAWMEAWNRLIDVILSADIPTAVVGDFNADFHEIKELTDRVPGLDAHDGTKVDHALGYNCTILGRKVLDQPPGWHGFIRWRFRAEI
jgi:endonuclease/exonuclease/phosphatase family metal-dependent hydrolase